MIIPRWVTRERLRSRPKWLVWRRRHTVRVVVPLLLFVEQLILNVAWPGVFFTLRNPALAAIEVNGLACGVGTRANHPCTQHRNAALRLPEIEQCCQAVSLCGFALQLIYL